MKILAHFIMTCLLLTSCSLLNSGQSSVGGWFEVSFEGADHYNIRDVHFLNADVGWAVGRKSDKNGHLAFLGFTINGGKYWSFKPVPDYTELRSVYFFDLATGVAVSRVFLFTQTAGDSFEIQKIREGAPPGGVYSVTFSSPTTGWAVGPFGAIARTTNGGETWRYLDVGHEEVRFNSAAGIGDDFALILSYDFLLRTVDGGASWKEINLQDALSAPPVRYHDIALTNTRRGWIVGEFRRILFTKDGGEHWELQYPKTDEQRSFDALLSVSAYDSLNAMAVSSHGAILRTSDGGTTWQEQLATKDDGSGFLQVQFVDAEVAYAVTGDGNLMKTVTGGYTGND